MSTRRTTVLGRFGSGALVAAVVLALAAGCDSGVLDDSGGRFNQGSIQPTSSGKLAPAHIRRLTSKDIRNSIRDVFGLDDSKFDWTVFPLEANPGEFDNQFATLSVSTTFTLPLQQAAEWAGEAVTAKLSAEIAAVPASNQAAYAQQFIATWGPRVYRRPLTSAESSTLLQVFTKTVQTDPFPTAIGTIVEAMLQSPNFLFRTELGASVGAATPLTPYELASELSYLLWQSAPDQALLDAAAQGHLNTPNDVRTQAQRMISDPRGGAALETMFIQWLGMANVSSLSKSDASFTPTMASSMTAEVGMFVSQIVWGGSNGFHDIFASPSTFIDSNLAALYGVTAPQASGLSPITLDATKHAGILTMPGFIAFKNPVGYRAPMKIGHFVRSWLFCQYLPPAPAGVPPPPPDPNLDEHARFAQHVSSPSCNGCHKMMDPIGFGWSQYDEMGRFSPVDHGVTEDGKGTLASTDVDGDFTGPVELGQRLASSKAVQQCFANVVAQWALGRSPSTDPGSADAPMQTQLNGSGFAQGDLKTLFVALTSADAFVFRDTTAVPQP